MITSTNEWPLYGLGQGATDALPNWTLTANPSLKTYAKHSRGCTLCDPTKQSHRKQMETCLSM
eukprot:3982739-Ditylum_brightwellii.AAC.1